MLQLLHAHNNRPLWKETPPPSQVFSVDSFAICWGGTTNTFVMQS